MQLLKRAVLPLVIVAGGVTLAYGLLAAKVVPTQTETEAVETYVDVIRAEPRDHTVTIRAMGLVRPEREVVLQPEVGGRVVEASNELVPGGRIAKGDLLLRIDPRDYSAAVAAVQAELAQAQLLVREERTLRQVAEHEWQTRPDAVGEDTLAFALREPHLEAAAARVSSARSRIEKAKRDLTRTTLRAPFDAIVLDETVDVGQMVGPQTPVARLAGIDGFWVQVSLPTSQLALLEIPGVNTEAPTGSAAKVLYEAGDGSTIQREGQTLRLLASVEQRGRMAQLLVGVDDPLDTQKPVAERRLPLLLDRYVEVVLQGRELAAVIELPSQAIRDDGTVWVVDAQSRLRPRKVDVAWREAGAVFVSGGLEPGAQVVTTPLAIATDGMKVALSPGSAAQNDVPSHP